MPVNILNLPGLNVLDFKETDDEYHVSAHLAFCHFFRGRQMKSEKTLGKATMVTHSHPMCSKRANQGIDLSETRFFIHHLAFGSHFTKQVLE